MSKSLILLVGAGRFELPTPCSRSNRVGESANREEILQYWSSRVPPKRRQPRYSTGSFHSENRIFGQRMRAAMTALSNEQTFGGRRDPKRASVIQSFRVA